MAEITSEIEYDKSEGRALRLLALYLHIEEHPGVKAEDLASAFKISPATLYRDIQSLKKLGITIDVTSPNRGGYRIEKGSIRFARVKAEDVRPLLIAKQLLHKMTYPQGDIFERLLKNMLSTVRDGEIDRIQEQLAQVLCFRSPLNRRFSMDSTEQVGILSRLLEATLNQWQVQFQYPTSGELCSRIFNPYGLWFGRNAWYVGGWCHTNKSLRTFAVDRIQSLEVLENKAFQRPTGFNFPQWVEASWIAMPPPDDNDIEEVLLEFEPKTGHEIAQFAWHPSQQSKIPSSPNEPVHIAFTLSKQSLENEFLGWVMSFGPRVKVIKPNWLQALIAEKIISWQLLYDTGS